MGPRPVERLGTMDLVELASDVGPVPRNVGCVLLLGQDHPAARPLDPDAVARTLVERVPAVRRLGQRLVRAPWGLGRPYWADDPAFDPAAHVTLLELAPTGGERPQESVAQGAEATLLRAATRVLGEPLPRARPLWRAVVVTQTRGGRAEAVAVVVVLHHVLADGIGGLAVLAELVDRPGPTRAARPRVVAPWPSRLDLARDATRGRVRRLLRLPQALRHARGGGTELGRGSGGRAPRCSINAPTGPHRAAAGVHVPLAAVRAGARRHGATVNDALLVAVTTALESVLIARGETVSELVVSVPVSARAAATDGSLGNQVGIMPVRVPLRGSPAERLGAVAALTRARKTHARGSSAALIGPVFRVVAAAGLFRWFVDRQTLVNSFLTNLAGPTTPLRLAGAEVLRVLPLSITAGNVGVAFAAFSYAGSLSVTVMVDADVVPEVTELASALGRALEAVAGA
ncbi:wax ester/triacylglycerol synthase domain-containing protein [Actinotalea subterranea]|uniref:wax ester/triacylglycerol synthase domain-containing protein n=1 Tax=Actinotalea subterranea TaxID=2607497 RepID=UPI0011EDE0C2|nr:wax ester/triacylglycerol synthase domain-containing protein [Actinotalea subterranea]